MAFDFTGKKVLVTGAGQGMGHGIALALAKAGCKVYALDCVQDNLDKLAAESTNVVTILQDLSNWDTARATLEGIEVLDGLVNCAGILKNDQPALETTKQNLDDHMAVNLFGTINCSQVVGKKMVDAGKKGSIVNISSINSALAAPRTLAYNITKAAIDMVTKQFALELGPHNIRVNSVNPTIVDTPMATTVIRETGGKKVTERMPIERIATIQDIVGPALYLLSDYSAMVTGTRQVVDGGLSCNITTKT